MKGILKELTAKLYSFFTLCSGAFILALAISFTKYMYFLSGEALF